MRVPTDKQAVPLRTLAGGAMLVSGIGGQRRLWKSLIAHGWVAPEFEGEENGIRITADGLRALAAVVDRDGWPDVRQSPHVERATPRREQQLREARDEAREERDEAEREARRLRVVVERAQRALNVSWP